jgi:drug/metabolite transporter (DMT)-like permease
MKSNLFNIVAGYILVCLIWGSTWFAIRLGLDSFTPLAGAGFRFTLAAFIFFIVIRYKKIEVKQDKLAIKIYLILAFFSFVIPYALLYWAQQHIASGLTSILFGVLPIFVLIFARFMLPENKILGFQWAGIILGFIGLIIIFSENLKVNIGTDLLGMIAILSAGIIQAVITVITKKYSSYINPIALNYYPTLIAGPILLLMAFVFEDHSRWIFDANGVISVLYLSLFGTVIAFSIYYWLMHKIDIVLIALSSIITPIIAVVMGCFILLEDFTINDIIGSSVVLIGVLFANFNDIINYLRQKRSNTEI